MALDKPSTQVRLRDLTERALRSIPERVWT
jgi:hypothetical protein